MRNKTAGFSELGSNFVHNRIGYVRIPVTEIEVMTLHLGLSQQCWSEKMRQQIRLSHTIGSSSHF